MAFSGAMVKKATDQTGADYTGDTAVAWDSEVYDVDGWHDTGANTSRLTVPGGVSYVVVTANLRVESATDEVVSATITKNGSASYQGAAQLVFDSGGTSFALSLKTGAVPVVAGDYFEVTLDTAADSSISVIAARSNFAIEKVGEDIVFSGAMVEKSADETGANYTAAPAVAWNAEIHDTGGWHDNVTNNSRLTVPADVAYAVVAANFRIEAGGNQQCSCTITKNGSASFDGAAQLLFQTGGATFNFSVKTGPVPVVATDFFEVTLQPASDTSINVIAARSNFSIYKAG